MTAAVGDMKAGLTSSKLKLSILPRAALTYLGRVLEYGAAKYRRGNYHGDPPKGVSPEARVAGYVDAALRHLTEVSDAYNVALGTGGDVRAALGVLDEEASGGFPASRLPHLGHALASISLAIVCAVADKILAADPGQPWTDEVKEDRSPEAAVQLVRHVGADGTVTQVRMPAETLWRGYRRADVLAVVKKICGELGAGRSEFRFNGDRIERRIPELGCEWGPTSWTAQEERLRVSGLRRPDEPDYKPLA